MVPGSIICFFCTVTYVYTGNETTAPPSHEPSPPNNPLYFQPPSTPPSPLPPSEGQQIPPTVRVMFPPLAPFTQSLSPNQPLLERQVPLSVVQDLLPHLTSIEKVLSPLLRDDADVQTRAEDRQDVPEGVVPAGFFYRGINADGEYFDEEMDEQDPLEIHGDQDAPGRQHNGDSEHPYYIVDKPAQGPSPPPLTYFTSGLRDDYGFHYDPVWEK